MEYYFVDEKVTRQDYIAEIRVNLRNVHNKYCSNKDNSNPIKALDLFRYCDTEDQQLKKKLKPFVEIAVELEGIEETFEEISDENFYEALSKLEKKLREEIKGV